MIQKIELKNGLWGGHNIGISQYQNPGDPDYISATLVMQTDQEGITHTYNLKADYLPIKEQVTIKQLARMRVDPYFEWIHPDLGADVKGHYTCPFHIQCKFTHITMEPGVTYKDTAFRGTGDGEGTTPFREVINMQTDGVKVIDKLAHTYPIVWYKKWGEEAQTTYPLFYCTYIYDSEKTWTDYMQVNMATYSYLHEIGFITIRDCLPQNPYFVAWVNNRGGIDSWIFGAKQKHKITVEANEYLLDNDYQYIATNKKAYETIECSAGLVNTTEFNGLSQLAYSPEIYHWNTEKKQWEQLLLDKCEPEYYNDARGLEFQCTFRTAETLQIR